MDATLSTEAQRLISEGVWRVHLDKKTSRQYFSHVQTRETVWNLDAHLKKQRRAQKLGPARAVDPAAPPGNVADASGPQADLAPCTVPSPVVKLVAHASSPACEPETRTAAATDGGTGASLGAPAEQPHHDVAEDMQAKAQLLRALRAEETRQQNETAAPGESAAALSIANLRARQAGVRMVLALSTKLLDAAGVLSAPRPLVGLACLWDGCTAINSVCMVEAHSRNALRLARLGGSDWSSFSANAEGPTLRHSGWHTVSTGLCLETLEFRNAVVAVDPATRILYLCCMRRAGMCCAAVWPVVGAGPLSLPLWAHFSPVLDGLERATGEGSGSRFAPPSATVRVTLLQEHTALTTALGNQLQGQILAHSPETGSPAGHIAPAAAEAEAPAGRKTSRRAAAASAPPPGEVPGRESSVVHDRVAWILQNPCC